MSKKEEKQKNKQTTTQETFY